MNLSRKARWVIILALVALLAVGGAGAVAAAGNQDAGWDPQHETHSHKGFGLRVDLLNREAIQAAVANALNVSPDELQAAMQAGRDSVQTLLNAAGLTPADLKSTVKAEIESQLAAAVAAGTLTQEEMDAILSHDHGWKGSRNGGRFFGHKWPTDAIDAQAVLQTAAASAGLDAEELLATLTEGRSALGTFLEANDTTPAEFKAALDIARQQAIADAVEAGTLSSEQAERLNRKGHHGRHGHGWSEHFGSQSPLENNT